MFAQVVELLGAEFFAQQQLSVVVCGATSDTPYASDICARLRQLPFVELRDFMEPEQLYELFAASVLNVHPALHDAYGMTCAEAAAAACPSLIAPDGAVGVTSFLGPNCFLPCPMQGTTKKQIKRRKEGGKPTDGAPKRM